MRIYFRSSIVDLEKLFESAGSDLKILKDLRAELQHRNTNRAKVLAKKVDERLSAVDQVTSTQPVASGWPTTSRKTLQRRSEAPIAVPNADTSEGPERSNAPVVATDWNSDHATITDDRTTPPNSFAEPIPHFENEIEVQAGADATLAAWLTLEVLTPQPIPDPRELEAVKRQLVRLEESPEPWCERRYWRRSTERAVYWMVYLGELDLAKAIEAILKLYPDDAKDERENVRGTSTLAVIVLDSYGRPIEDRAFLSSFAWGYGQVLGGRLKGLAAFATAEGKIRAALQQRLIRQDEDGKVLPLTATDIDQTITWLAKVLNLPENEVRRPGIAIRVPYSGAYPEAPEPELLNSFFIEDLIKIREALIRNELGEAISAYLTTSTRERQDVVQDKQLVAKTLAPSRMPLARWPGPGRHPLVLMQQAAVNHAIAELTNSGIIAVNGPPGTGKTTLLRDIVAKVVLDRAIEMAKFDKPIEAFSHATSMRTGQAYTHLYKLHETLLGHEIVVASSNNKAVENISREIPSMSAIANDLPLPPRYFQSIADSVAVGKNQIVEGATWGLAAAVLGNSNNRSAFAEAFWWHKKRGMNVYLKGVLASEDTEEDEDDKIDGNEEQKLLHVLALEKPPRGEIEALECWHAARRDFLEKKRL